MKTKLFLLVLFAVAILCACTGKKTVNNQPDENNTSEDLKEVVVDLQQDISKLSLSELRLLRNWVYAQYGYLFMEADLRGYFSANFKQYDSLMWARWEMEEGIYYKAMEDKEEAKIPKIVLTIEEEDFVKKIDAKIAELKRTDYVEKGGFRLANPNNIVNLFQFTGFSDEFNQKLAVNNMVVTKSNNIQLFHIYEENDYRQIPNFITTDLMLQAFHIYFSSLLSGYKSNSFSCLSSTGVVGL